MIFKPPQEFTTRAAYWEYMMLCHSDLPADKLAAAVAWLTEEELKPAAESRASVWHAIAVTYNRVATCHCMPCTKERDTLSRAMEAALAERRK